MNTNYAQKQVRRIARNIIIQSAIIIGIICVIIYTQAASFTNLFVETATPTSADNLTELMDQKKTFVDLQADEFGFSGLYRTKDNKNVNRYYWLLLDDKLVICQTDMSLTEDLYRNYKVSGKIIEPDSVGSKIIQEMDNVMASELRDTSNTSYCAPYIIDMTANRLLEQVLCAIGFVLIALLLFRALSQFRFFVAHTTNKWYKKLANLDPTQNADRVNEMVSRELDAGEYVFKTGNAILMRNWAVFPKFSRFSIQRTSDLLWIYKTVTQHRTNGIPTGKSYSITLRFRDKSTENLISKKKSADDLLQSLKESYPHVFTGYSEQLVKIFNQNVDEFIQAINQASENTDRTNY